MEGVSIVHQRTDDIRRILLKAQETVTGRGFYQPAFGANCQHVIAQLTREGLVGHGDHAGFGLSDIVFGDSARILDVFRQSAIVFVRLEQIRREEGVLDQRAAFGEWQHVEKAHGAFLRRAKVEHGHHARIEGVYRCFYLPAFEVLFEIVVAFGAAGDVFDVEDTVESKARSMRHAINHYFRGPFVRRFAYLGYSPALKGDARHIGERLAHPFVVIDPADHAVLVRPRIVDLVEIVADELNLIPGAVGQVIDAGGIHGPIAPCPVVAVFGIALGDEDRLPAQV